MFGLSWGQIAIIVLVGIFVLGPERIPTAVTWVMSTLRKARTMAAGAQAELRREIGPELDELRRQVADLQSLKEIQELRELRDLHPKRLISKNILGDEFSGGITGFLGLNESSAPPAPSIANGPASVTNGTVTSDRTKGLTKGPDNNRNAPATVGPSPAAGNTNSAPAGSGYSPTLPKLAAPKVVGTHVPQNAPSKPSLASSTPFDPDGT